MWVIEKTAGAKENNFYIDQLDDAEKDVKEAMILALSHDEGNTEILTELVKTEKAKNKKAALYVLTTFDNEKAIEFVTEYSKKKPADVLELIQYSSAKWASELTADITKRVLTDENGNIIKISQLTNMDKVKVIPQDIANALYFKTGKAIEDIYRSYGDIKCAGFLSTALMYSIAETMDSGLISLAAELNNTPEYKGIYDQAEAAARILGDEDCSEWIKKNIESSVNFLYSVSIENGRFVYLRSCGYNSVINKYIQVRREVHQPIKEKITDILIKADHERTSYTLERWIDPDDPEYCLKLGSYFAKCFEKYKDGHYVYLSSMRKCGVKNVKGIICRHFSGDGFKLFQQINLYELKDIFRMLPGDAKHKLSEARSLIDSVKKGSIKKITFDTEKFSEWIENEMNKE